MVIQAKCKRTFADDYLTFDVEILLSSSYVPLPIPFFNHPALSLLTCRRAAGRAIVCFFYNPAKTNQ